MLKLHKLLMVALAAAFCLSCWPSKAKAQVEEKKFEVGVQFATLRNNYAYWPTDESTIGGGGRVTYNFTKEFALEGEVNYFPGNGYYNTRRWQALIGAKTGVRFDKVGFFGKIRPGAMTTRTEVPLVCIQAPCPPYRETETRFALDVGGVVEFYPANRILVRFDAGDTIVRQPNFYPDPRVLAYTTLLYAPPRTTHNFQLNAGVGFRF
jgi:hypothetical protein